MRSLISLSVLTLAIVAGAHAEPERARFQVTAVVPARATLDALVQADRLTISDDDVRRGYKIVAAQYVVDLATERGWLLRLSPRVGLTRQIEVRGLANDVILRQDSVEVFRPGTSGRERLSLEYRLVLDPAARPGTYDLPLHLSATPL